MLPENQHRQQNAVNRFQIVTQIYRERGDRLQGPDLAPVQPHRAEEREEQQFPRLRQRRHQSRGRKQQKVERQQQRQREKSAAHLLIQDRLRRKTSSEKAGGYRVQRREKRGNHSQQDPRPVTQVECEKQQNSGNC